MTQGRPNQFKKVYAVPGYKPSGLRPAKRKLSEAQRAHALEYYREKQFARQLHERIYTED
jgi:hypothetical protein